MGAGLAQFDACPECGGTPPGVVLTRTVHECPECVQAWVEEVCGQCGLKITVVACSHMDEKTKREMEEDDVGTGK